MRPPLLCGAGLNHAVACCQSVETPKPRVEQVSRPVLRSELDSSGVPPAEEHANPFPILWLVSPRQQRRESCRPARFADDAEYTPETLLRAPDCIVMNQHHAI